MIVCICHVILPDAHECEQFRIHVARPQGRIYILDYINKIRRF